VGSSQGLDPLELLLPFAGQEQGVGAPVARRWQAAGEAALLQCVEQAHEPRPLDAQGVGKVGLGESGIGVDDDQHRVLRGTDIEARQRAHEVLEDPDLESPHEIAEVAVEHAEIDDAPLSARAIAGSERLAFVRLFLDVQLGHEAGLSLLTTSIVLSNNNCEVGVKVKSYFALATPPLAFHEASALECGRPQTGQREELQ
jgi:hypothetical protein